MANLKDLKSQVRSLERGGQHGPALELYNRQMNEAPDELDAGAWAHAGDLQMRLGAERDAAASFGRAADLYAQKGLRNLALALSHKLLRADPACANSYFRIGELSAAQGYVRDARSGFLQYAERMEKAGDVEAAITALRKHLAAFPDDPDVLGRLAGLGGAEAEPDHALIDLRHATAEETAVPASPVAPLEGLEPTHLAEGPESTQSDHEELPLLDAAAAAPQQVAEREAEPKAEPDAPEEPAPLPLLAPDPEAPAAADASSTDYVDLAALILSDDPERADVPTREFAGDEQKDLNEVLDLFREKVTHSIDPKDAASHYDLGLAFKEMGLLDDAVSQLQRALRGGANLLATLEVLGECFAEKGDYEVGARVLDRATKLHDAREADLVGVFYWLGRCREALGETPAALSCYERVVAVDAGFHDASDRLGALRVA